MAIQDIAKVIESNFEEVLTAEDLKKLLDSRETIKHYIGFEISGKVHLGTGLVSMLKLKELQDLGVKASVFLADWHSWINEKLDGKLSTIKDIAVSYFKEAIIASLKCVGADPSKVDFVLGSDLYHNHDDYWATVIEVSKNTSLSRMRRSINILGRRESDETDFAKLIYPAMQVADIFFQGIHIAHAGTDQRKAHVIMRDVWSKIRDDLKIGYDQEFLRLGIKPIALHHHLLLGLEGGRWTASREDIENLKKEEGLSEFLSEFKMSKSKPDSAVFIHDSKDEIERKVKKAFCPSGVTAYPNNPIIDWVENLIFPLKKGIEIARKPEHGGTVSYGADEFNRLEKDYQGNKLHPDDLKKAVAYNLVDILRPAREHFDSKEPHAALKYLEKFQK